MSDRLSSPTYLVRRKVLTLAGAAFHICDGEGRLVLSRSSRPSGSRRTSDSSTGEDMREELLAIHARQVLDISATYDVTDSQTGEKVGRSSGEGCGRSCATVAPAGCQRP